MLYKLDMTPEQALEALDGVIAGVRRAPLPADELEQVKVKFRSDYYSSLEGGMGSAAPRFGLMHLLACFTLFDGDPHLVNTILDGFAGVTPGEVHRVAERYLRRENRAIVFRLPAAQTPAASD
jgi:predicted Zn-dependent peptidase